jgi:hypothetical protein
MPVRRIADPGSEVLSKIMLFTSDIAAHVNGVPKFGADAGLIEALLKIYDSFRDEVQRTAPRFRPWTKGQSSVNEGELERLAEQGNHVNGTGEILYLDETIVRARR